MADSNEWHKIGSQLTTYFGICSCQRKLKSIVDNLSSIKQKCIDAYDKGTPRDFTGAEWLLLAIMNSMPDQKGNTPVMHGTNCEYPIINESHFFWKWLDEVKNNPNLEDN